jgi:hypothetical protein
VVEAVDDWWAEVVPASWPALLAKHVVAVRKRISTSLTPPG